MRRIRTIAVLLIAATYACVRSAGQSQSVPLTPRGGSEPKGWFAISPDQRVWGKADNIGRQTAVVFGDRSKPGLYGILVKWPPKVSAKAHSHPDERYAFVVSGTFYHGHGDKFDASKLERRSSGTVFGEPAGVAHFGATKGDGAILYFVGMGPDRTDPIE